MKTPFPIETVRQLLPVVDGVHVSRIQSLVGADAIAAIAPALRPHGLSLPRVLRTTDRFPTTVREPWAFVFFPRELCLPGHVANLRPSTKDIGMIPYSYVAGRDPVPRLGGYMIRNKAVLEKAAKRSRLFQPAWRCLRDHDEDGRWVYLSELPPADWLDTVSAGDAELYFSCPTGGKRPPWLVELEAIRDPGCTYRYAVALELAQAGQCESASRFLDSVLGHYPGLGHGWSVLGLCYRNVGETGRALECLLASARLLPDVEETWIELAGIYLEQGANQEALCAILRATEKKPRTALCWRILGQVRRALRDTDGALAACLRAVVTDPFDEMAWGDLGILLDRSDRPADAVQPFAQAIRLAPRCARNWNNWAFALTQTGRANEAVPAARQALALEPEDAHAWDTLGVALAETGQHREAASAFEQALELNPDNLESLENLVRTRLVLEDYHAVSAHLVHIRGIAPERADQLSRQLGNQVPVVPDRLKGDTTT